MELLLSVLLLYVCWLVLTSSVFWGFVAVVIAGALWILSPMFRFAVCATAFLGIMFVLASN